MVTGSPADAAVERPDPSSQRIDLWVAPNDRQRRWTVLLRAFLVLPHLVVLYVLGIAASVITVIGWFGALFTGRLPDFAANFLGGVLRWQARVWAYGWLLTDRYPPFTLDQAPEYAVRVDIRPGPLNRLAVLFRVILAVPLVVVTALVELGAAVLQVVAWLVTLIIGRLPRPFHEGFRSVVRLQIRYTGYWRMLSSDYGWWNLFGDLPEGEHPTVVPPGPPPPPSPGAPPPPAAPPVPPAVATMPAAPPPGTVSQEAPKWAEPSSVAQPAPAAASAAEPAAAEAEVVGPPTGGAPRNGWRLIMGPGGRAVVIVSILLGIVLAVGYSTALAVLAANSSTATTARQQTATAEQHLAQGIRTANVNLTVCHSLVCARRQSAVVARDLRQFGAAVSRIDYPSPADADVSALQGSIHEAAGAFGLLASSPSRAAFDRRLLPAREKLSVVFSEYELLDQQLRSLE